MNQPLLVASVLAVLAPAALSPATASKDRLLQVSTRRTVTLAQALPDLRKARVIFLGEAHDNRSHHEAQLKVLRALTQAGAAVAVGLEMFRSAAQGALDEWSAGRLGEGELYDVFTENWNFGWWPLYTPIFQYAKERRLPLVGLNVARGLVNRVARRGFDSLSDAEKQELGVLTCDVDPRYQELMAALTGTADRDAPHFQRFCQAQLVWDTAMAKRIVEFAEDNPRHTVVVLAGTFHAWKHGIPEQLQRRASLPYRVVLPAVDEAAARYEVSTEDADYLWLHPPPDPVPPVRSRAP